MLVIRRAQLEVFERHMQGKRAAEHAAMMALSWPAECAALGEAGVRERVASAIERAARLGFTSAAAETRFLHLHFLWGGDLEEQAWAKAILGWPADAETRLRALEQRAALEVEGRRSS